MGHRPLDAQATDQTAPLESDGRGSRTAERQPSGDALVLQELAGLDELLRGRDAAWKELVRRLDSLRREIAVTSAQVQRSRTLAVRKASRDGDADQGAGPPTSSRDEARAPELTKEFEAALRDTEGQRLVLHAEMDDLRRRRQGLLRRLPAPISRAYQSLVDVGCMAPIADVTGSVCGGCESPLPHFVIETLSHGAVAICARCERLLGVFGSGR
jgi:hypothetical protein